MMDNLTCTKCRRMYPIARMRNITDVKSRICVDCLKKAKAEPEKKAKVVIEKRKWRYKCRKCDHIFVIKEGFNKQCPFCSSMDVTNQEWNSDLDQLIRDSGQRLYDN